MLLTCLVELLLCPFVVFGKHTLQGLLFAFMPLKPSILLTLLKLLLPFAHCLNSISTYYNFVYRRVAVFQHH